MKRSEMLEIIAQKLKNLGIVSVHNEDILTAIEKAGMRPPVNFKDTNSGVSIALACMEEAWEPENS